MARKHTTRDQGGVLYRVTNLINGKVYFGITAFEPADFRWTTHQEAAKAGKKTLIARAIRKYGAEAFFFKVIGRFETREDMCAAECRYIAALKPHYNLTDGGQGNWGFRHTPESKAKMSAALRRAWAETPEKFANRPPHSAETRRRMSEIKKVNPTKPWLGKKRSAETSAKISATKKGNSPRPPAHVIENLKVAGRARHEQLKKPIRCLWDGREFESGIQAANYYGLDARSPNVVANGKRRAVRGLTFEWIAP